MQITKNKSRRTKTQKSSGHIKKQIMTFINTKQNKDKKGELEAELSKLTLQLEVLPKKGYREERAELKSKIENVKDILKLL